MFAGLAFSFENVVWHQAEKNIHRNHQVGRGCKERVEDCMKKTIVGDGDL
jgi:hypothetical protein